jgi:hypothetical protein
MSACLESQAGAIGLSLLLCACGSPARPSATQSVLTDSGRYALHVSSDPDPPVRGVNMMAIRITDGMDHRVDGLVLDVLPWMPSHGHGASVHPSVSAKGGGDYQVENVVFYMAGSWELRTRFLDERATAVFQIP